MAPLRIFIADDHDLIRRGLKSLLESQREWQVCGEARTGTEAVAKIEQLRPHIAILDITMPELNGLDATRQIKKLCPEPEVLLLSVHFLDNLMRDSIEAGALGYVLKSDADQDLLRAIKSAAQHKPFYTSHTTELMLTNFKGQLVPSRLAGDHLTSRERQVLQLLSEGKSIKEVASALNLSLKTTETHRANIMHKLNVHSIGELVRYAVRNRIIEA